MFCFQVIEVCIAYLKHHKVNLARAEVCKVVWDHRSFSYLSTIELRMVFTFLKGWWVGKRGILGKRYLYPTKPKMLNSSTLYRKSLLNPGMECWFFFLLLLVCFLNLILILGHKVSVHIFSRGIILKKICNNGTKYLGENIVCVLFLDLFEIRNYE